MKERYDVTGMSCASCSAHVEKAVAGLPGMKVCQVNLLTNSMAVEYDPAVCSSETVIGAVEHAGYGAVLHEDRAEQPGQGPAALSAGEKKGRNIAQEELQNMRFRLRVSFLFLIPLMYLGMGHMAGLPLPGIFTGPGNTLTYAFTQMLLVLPVMYVNRKYYIGGTKALLHGAPNMDSLISVGSLASFIYGVAAIYAIGYALGHGNPDAAMAWRKDLYFESVSMILSLITLGKYFETRSKAGTSEAIGKLMDLRPKTAHVIRNGQESTVPTEELRNGDLLLVRPGESIPADGILKEGSTSVDESAITGESIPADKKPGDLLTGATINLNGSIRMEATHVGADSTLAKIVALVEEASSSKAPISKLADRISGVFVPVVMGISLLTFLVWFFGGQTFSFALSRAIAVLVISCPCALGLATPVAIMVGTGKAAEYGILFRSAEALETLHEAETVVLDKTGTVTEGKPVVTDLLPADGTSAAEFLQYAASLEAGSEHPLASAVRDAAGKRGLTLLPVAGFVNEPGRGISAAVNGHGMTAGNNPAGHTEAENSGALAGKTLLYFNRDGKPLGTAAVADTIKKDSRTAIEALKARGMKVVLLTGDREEAAQAIAAQAGIGQVIAGVLPDGKEQQVRALQKQGGRVIMIGDGINDSPALAGADVGIAIGNGTDIAIESADVVLMRDSLMDAVTAIDLSRAVIRNIRENLFWAFFYNAVGIPLAAGAFYLSLGWKLNPMFGAAAMSMSSVCVVSNALRLRNFRPQKEASRLNGKMQAAEHKKENKTEHVAEDRTEHKAENAAEPETEPKTEPTTAAAVQKQKEEQIMETTVKVNGMMCGHCKATVEKALKALPGVTDATADLEKKQAVVTHDGSVSVEAMLKAVTDAGYEAAK